MQLWNLLLYKGGLPGETTFGRGWLKSRHNKILSTDTQDEAGVVNPLKITLFQFLNLSNHADFPIDPNLIPLFCNFFHFLLRVFPFRIVL